MTINNIFFLYVLHGHGGLFDLKIKNKIIIQHQEINLILRICWMDLGTNLSFVELLDSVQKGTLLQRINVGPLSLKGDFLSRYSHRDLQWRQHVVFALVLAWG
jgi:hypothetical protein